MSREDRSLLEPSGPFTLIGLFVGPMRKRLFNITIRFHSSKNLNIDGDSIRWVFKMMCWVCALVGILSILIGWELQYCFINLKIRISDWDDMSCITVQNPSEFDQTHSFSPCYRPAPAAVHTLVDDSINQQGRGIIRDNPDRWKHSSSGPVIPHKHIMDNKRT